MGQILFQVILHAGSLMSWGSCPGTCVWGVCIHINIQMQKAQAASEDYINIEIIILVLKLYFQTLLTCFVPVQICF